MMGVVLLLSLLTCAKETGPGSAKREPRLATTYCWMADTRQSGLTSFSRHSFCIGLMVLAPCVHQPLQLHSLVLHGSVMTEACDV